MKIFNLVRFLKSEEGTYGILMHSNSVDIICCTVEPPWKGNQLSKSCIPAGFYRAVLSVRHAELPSNYKVYQVVNIPGRTVIQIHIANTPSELEGCIAPVTVFHNFKGEQGGSGSKNAFNKFMNVCAGDEKIGIWIKESCLDVNQYTGIITNTGE